MKWIEYCGYKYMQDVDTEDKIKKQKEERKRNVTGKK
jgi:hypothetical protein